MKPPTPQQAVEACSKCPRGAFGPASCQKTACAAWTNRPGAADESQNVEAAPKSQTEQPAPFVAPDAHERENQAGRKRRRRTRNASQPANLQRKRPRRDKARASSTSETRTVNAPGVMNKPADR
jgi:hypothetical protein